MTQSQLELTQAIVCPSGLSGTIRGLKVREERVLADRRLAKDGRQIDGLLNACWLETSDAGPYAGRVGDSVASLPWDKVLQGDRFFVLLQIRALTYGDEYAFTVECSNADCKRKINWALNLKELPLRALASETRDAFVASRPLETTLPGLGRRVMFTLATGADEARATKLRDAQPDRILSGMLASRIVEIDGVTAQDMRRVIEDLPMRDAMHLVQEFERVDCGVETGIEIECSKCLHVMEIDLPLDPSFLWPKAKSAASSRSAG